MKGALLLLLLAGLTLTHGLGEMKPYACVHDTLFKDNVVRELPEFTTEHARILQTGGSTTTATGTSGTSTSAGATTTAVVDGWHQLRITIDFSYADKLVKSNSALTSKYQLSIRLMESVRSYFSKYAQVNAPPTMDSPGGDCQGNIIPVFSKPTDLYITIVAQNDPKTAYFAAAAACYASKRDGRPIIGAYLLNLAFLQTEFYHEFLYFSTFAHEFTHILGFSSNLYASFVKPGTTTKRTDVVGKTSIGAETFDTITMPEVVNFAKSFFACNNIPGVPLENNGGSGSAGSHWEKLFLPQEYMNPTVENPGVLSDFTMTFLRATGWYQIAAGASQRYDWGQNSGCGVFNICPQNSTGYCSAAQVSQTICSSEWMSKGSCIQDKTFSSGCYVKRSQEHTCLFNGPWQTLSSNSNQEAFEPGARCINYKGLGGYMAQCHKTTCSASGISITVGKNTVTCGTTEGGVTKNVGWYFDLECPDFNDFCNEFNSRCANDCSAGGLCTSAKECLCYTGFTGSDCSSKATVDYAKITSLDYTGKNAFISVVSLITLALAFFGAF